MRFHTRCVRVCKMGTVLKETSFWERARKYLQEYNNSTSIHGLRYLTQERSLAEKIVWSIIVLTSISGCIYMISEIVRKYDISPVVVNFATEDTPLYQIPFPAVTICPEAKFSSQLFNYTDFYFKNSSTENLSQIRNFTYLNLLCNGESWKMGNKTVDDDFFKVITELAPEFEIECTMNETYLKTYDVFTRVIIDQGICYSFNMLDRSHIFRDNVAHYEDFYYVKQASHDFDAEWGYSEEAGIETYPRRALMSGADNSFDIYFKYNSNDTDYICNAFHQGYRILIHSPWDVPHLSSYYFRVPLDKAVIAAVDPELIVTSEDVENFHPNKRKCYMTHERPLKYFKMYTESNCFFECLTNYTLENCGCVQYYMPRNESTPICGTGSYECTKTAENELKIKNIKTKLSGKTYCDCKPQCSALRYHVENSHSDFSWRNYFKIHKRYGMANEGGFGEEIHYSVLSIYLKSEQIITLERRELYGISDFIANFGGLLGLFTGFSLISLLEIIYFFTLRIFCNQRLYGHWSGR